MEPMSNTSAPIAAASATRNDQTSLSPDRAFVVHFYAAAAGAEIEAGRAEHVRSGQTTHFRSWEELAQFVAAVVGAPASSPGTNF
jgi:hypothetical protein